MPTKKPLDPKDLMRDNPLVLAKQEQEQKWRDFVISDKSLLRSKDKRWRTNLLFHEYKGPKPEGETVQPIFTIKEDDHDGCISLRRVYLANEDPTEYYFAHKVFGSWDCWQAIRSCLVMRAEISKWQTELDIRLRSKAFLKVLEESKDKNSKFCYDANKLLIKEGWKLDYQKEKVSRGRPSKQEVKAELDKQSALEKKILDDAKKMGLVVSLEEAVGG